MVSDLLEDILAFLYATGDGKSATTGTDDTTCQYCAAELEENEETGEIHCPECGTFTKVLEIQINTESSQWLVADDDKDGLFCQKCHGAEKKLIRLQNPEQGQLAISLVSICLNQERHLNNPMKPMNYQKYFKQLMKKYPLKIKIPVSLELPETINYNNSTPFGLASLKNKKIYIQVATQDRHPLLIIKTIAHEYRHAMQWINMGWRSDNPSDPKMEHDANLFGQQEARLIMGIKRI